MKEGEIIKILVAIPCMSKVDTDFMMSMLRLRRIHDTHYSTSVASLIYDSRNAFAARAITEGYDRVLFIDSDMIFEPDLLKRLSDDMDTGLDYVSGLFFTRKSPVKPMIYKTLDVSKAEDGTPMAVTETYTDYPRDTLFEVQGSGFGAVLIRTDLMRKVWDTYGPPFMPVPTLGEDLAFCYRARSLGAKLYCDSRVKLGHIGTVVFDETLYTPPGESRTDMYQSETPIGNVKNAIPDMRKQKRK